LAGGHARNVFPRALLSGAFSGRSLGRYVKILKSPAPLQTPIEWSDYGQRTYEYGADGALERITLSGVSDRPEIEYRRTKPGETAETVAKEIEDKLVGLIPDVLQTLRVEKPLYCVFLCYCSSGWELTPDVCLAKAKERDPDLLDLDTIWNPAELSEAVHIDLDDPALHDRWNLFYQLMGREEDFSVCVNMLRHVAQRLNAHGAVAGLPGTDDFIFTACDTSDGVMIGDDLPASVPPKRLKLLKQRGFWE
jgi:hypothetical protein